MDYFNGLDSTRKDMNPHLTLLKYGCLAIILALLYFKVGLSCFSRKVSSFLYRQILFAWCCKPITIGIEFIGLGLIIYCSFLQKSLWHLQNIKNERALHKIQKVGNDMATVLISAFCSALHSNNSSAAKVMRICE